MSIDYHITGIHWTCFLHSSCTVISLAECTIDFGALMVGQMAAEAFLDPVPQAQLSNTSTLGFSHFSLSLFISSAFSLCRLSDGEPSINYVRSFVRRPATCSHTDEAICPPSKCEKSVRCQSSVVQGRVFGYKPLMDVDVG